MAKLMPFSLTLIAVVLDQLSKSAIEAALRIGERVEVIGSLLWLWHVRNTGMAFSVGSRLPGNVRGFLFLLLPIVVLAGLLVYYFKSKDLTGVQRWCFAAILGGGLGNLIDRIFRTGGVIDFISVKFYGILGMERYPTFNIADSTVVISVVVMMISFIIIRKRGTDE